MSLPAAIVWLAIPVFQWDLSAGDAGLVAEGDTLQWSYGIEPAAGPGPADPVWATVPDGTYLNDADDWLRIDLPDLSGTARPHLILEQWVAVRALDRAVIELDEGAGYVQVEPVGGYPSPDGFSGVSASSASWQEVVVPLVPVAGARLRLRLEANLVLTDAGWYVRSAEVVDGDVVPPLVTPLVEPVDTQDLVGPYLVAVDIDDDTQGLDAVLNYAVDGVAQPSISMANVEPGRFEAEIPAPPLSSRSVVEWWVEADDGELVGRYPEVGDATFDVFLSAPSELQADVELRFVGQEVPLSWLPPDAPVHPIVSYEVRPVEGEGCDVVGQAPVATDEPLATWPLDDQGTSCVEVVALHDVPGGPDAGLASEPSDTLVLDIEVPELIALEPDEGFAGAVQWVDLSGVSLYLDPLRPPDLGPTATVSSWEVLDAHRGRMQVALEEGATTGPLDLVVSGRYGDAWFPDAFVVRDAGEAPRILSVFPQVVTQGDDVELVVQGSEPFGSDVQVLGGGDVFAIGPAEVDGQRLTLPLSISTRARLGERSLLVDDGLRLWVVPLTVSEYRTPIRSGCQIAPSAGAGVLGWFVALAGLRRRRCVEVPARR